jgi:uncharacterized protein (UPF0276 family)
MTSPLPRRAGIGLRAEHHADFAAARPPVAFVEAHSENYFGRGGPPLHYLALARAHCPLSLHGVGLSLGSADPLNEAHLQCLAALVERMEPAQVSDHLCWCSVGGVYANDLLPLPFTEEALAHVVSRVQQVQERLGRQLLVENVSSYLQFADAAMPEWEFLAELSRRSGCGLLLDVNNIHVSAANHRFDALQYLAGVPVAAVQEIHLAGHTVQRLEDGEILIDTHDGPVCDAVWALYERALARFGPVPTLIEWDADLPPLATLVAEAQKADRMLEAADAAAA